MPRLGAVVGGRGTYEAAEALGRQEPVGDAVLHRHPPARGAAGRATTSCSSAASPRRSSGREAAAGDKEVNLMGGADVIRQALAAGLVDELTIIVAPVVARRRQAAVRWVHRARARAPGRAPVAVRDVHRVPGAPVVRLRPGGARPPGRDRSSPCGRRRSGWSRGRPAPRRRIAVTGERRHRPHSNRSQRSGSRRVLRGGEARANRSPSI